MACLLLFIGAGCSSTNAVTSGESSQLNAKPAPADGTSDNLEALYWARKDSARQSFTKADVHFMTGMIAHHAQALIMSRLAPTNGAGPSVMTLTSRILNAQRDEIKTMQGWLRDRGQPVPEVVINGLDLQILGIKDHVMHMPGMLSQAQLVELSEAKGTAFDKLFLKYMIQHHSGAVDMVDKLFAQDGAAQDELAFKLASDINVDQRTEIARMQRMLDALSN